MSDNLMWIQKDNPRTHILNHQLCFHDGFSNVLSKLLSVMRVLAGGELPSLELLVDAPHLLVCVSLQLLPLVGHPPCS